jgi:hypothetical protein
VFGNPLGSDFADFGLIAIGQKHPGVMLGPEIAQATIWDANYLAVPADIVLPIGRTTDLKSVATLVSHFESPTSIGGVAYIRYASTSSKRVAPSS